MQPSAERASNTPPGDTNSSHLTAATPRPRSPGRWGERPAGRAAARSGPALPRLAGPPLGVRAQAPGAAGRARVRGPAPRPAPPPPSRAPRPGRGGAVVYVPSAQSEWRPHALRSTTGRLGARGAEAAKEAGLARPGSRAGAEVAVCRAGRAPSAPGGDEALRRRPALRCRTRRRGSVRARGGEPASLRRGAASAWRSDGPCRSARSPVPGEAVRPPPLLLGRRRRHGQ